MNIRIDATTLQSALRLVLKAVDSNPTLPILRGVRLGLEDGMLRLSGTNLQITVETVVGVAVDEAGPPVVIPAKILQDIVGTMDGTVTISTDDKIAHLKAGQVKSKINLLSADGYDFPLPPNAPLDEFFTCPGFVFADAVERVAFAAAQQDNRPILTTINTRVADDGTITLATADGFRLAVTTISGSAPKAAAHNINADAASLAGKAINPALPITVLANSERVVFQQPGLLITSSVMDGRFPDYESVVPRPLPSNQIIMPRDEVIVALKRVTLFSKDNAFSSLISWGQDGQFVAVFRGRSVERGDCQDVVGGQVIGAPFEASYNSKYLLEIAQALDSELIMYACNAPDNPLLVYPASPGGPDEGTLYVVMPMGK